MTRFPPSRHSRSRSASTVLTLLLTALLALPLAAAADGLYLHVHVEDDGGETVNVNLPLNAIGSMLPMLEQQMGDDAYVALDEYDVSLEQMRATWRELRNQPDFVLATVESDDANVHVAKEGDYLVARVHDVADAGSARVHARIPARVVDALLSGQDGRLDLRAALDALAAEGEGELVTVEEDSSRVRVWVDGAAAAR